MPQLVQLPHSSTDEELPTANEARASKAEEAEGNVVLLKRRPSAEGRAFAGQAPEKQSSGRRRDSTNAPSLGGSGSTRSRIVPGGLQSLPGGDIRPGDYLPYRRMSRIFDEDDSARKAAAAAVGRSRSKARQALQEDDDQEAANNNKGPAAALGPARSATDVSEAASTARPSSAKSGQSGRGSPPAFTAAPAYLSYAPDEDTML